MTQSQGAAPRQNPLVQMMQELTADRQRLRQMVNPTAEKLTLEINDTLLAYLSDLIGHVGNQHNQLMQLHGWLNHVMGDIDARLGEQERRVDDLESDEPPALDSELAMLFAECIGRGKGMAELAMQQAGGNMPADAKAELTAYIEKCDQAISALDDMMSDDDGDGDEDESDDAEQLAPAPGNGQQLQPRS